MRRMPILIVLTMLLLPASLMAAEIDAISGASYGAPPSVPRPEKEVRQAIKDWLQKHWLMNVATTSEDGAPNISGAVYSVEDFTVFFAARKSSIKIQNVMRDPRITYSVWDPERNMRHLRILEVVGKATILEGEERDRASKEFDGYPFRDDFAVVRIDPVIARWTDRSRPVDYTDIIRLDKD